MFIATLFTTAKVWDQLRCSLMDEIDKDIVVYIRGLQKVREKMEFKDKFIGASIVT